MREVDSGVAKQVLGCNDGFGKEECGDEVHRECFDWMIETFGSRRGNASAVYPLYHTSTLPAIDRRQVRLPFF